MTIQPTSGVVLVELAASNFGELIPLPEKNFDSITHGTILAVGSPQDFADWVGCTAFWRQYKDDCRVDDGSGRKLALIEAKDILGVTDASTDTPT